MSNLAVQPTQVVTQMGTEDCSFWCTAANDWRFPPSNAYIKNAWNYASKYTGTILLYRFAGTTFCQAPKIIQLILLYAMSSNHFYKF
jgi:hypothetical protein